MTRLEKNSYLTAKRDKEGVIISVLNFLLLIFPIWFSILNNLIIMDSLIGIMKDFISRFFTMYPFYTLWIIKVTYGFRMFSRSIKREHWEETSPTNSFQPSVPLFYPLWTSENMRFSFVWRGCEIGTLGRKNGWNIS